MRDETREEWLASCQSDLIVYEVRTGETFDTLGTDLFTLTNGWQGSMYHQELPVAEAIDGLLEVAEQFRIAAKQPSAEPHQEVQAQHPGQCKL